MSKLGTSTISLSRSSYLVAHKLNIEVKVIYQSNNRTVKCQSNQTIGIKSPTGTEGKGVVIDQIAYPPTRSPVNKWIKRNKQRRDKCYVLYAISDPFRYFFFSSPFRYSVLISFRYFVLIFLGLFLALSSQFQFQFLVLRFI